MCPGSWEGGNKGHRVVRFLRKGMAVGWNIKKCQDQRVCSLSTLQGLALPGSVMLTHTWEGSSKAQAAESRRLLEPVPSSEGTNERWSESVLWPGGWGRLGNFFSSAILVSQLRTQWKPENPCSSASELPSWSWSQEGSGEDVLKQKTSSPQLPALLVGPIPSCLLRACLKMLSVVWDRVWEGANKKRIRHICWRIPYGCIRSGFKVFYWIRKVSCTEVDAQIIMHYEFLLFLSAYFPSFHKIS